jgi:hypothetical protein
MRVSEVEHDLEHVHKELARMSQLGVFTLEQQTEWHKLNGHHSFLLNKILNLGRSRKFEEYFHKSFPDIK